MQRFTQQETRWPNWTWAKDESDTCGVCGKRLILVCPFNLLLYFAALVGVGILIGLLIAP